MSRNKGSKGAERNRTAAVEGALQLADSLDRVGCRVAEVLFRALVIGGGDLADRLIEICTEASTEVERATIRDVFGEHAAAANHFRDDPSRSILSPVAECLLALDTANLKKLAATGEPVTTCAAYEEFRDAWSPKVSTFYSRGLKFSEALRIVGSTDMERALYDLSKKNPGGRPKKGETGMSKEEACAYVALAIEDNYGRLISWEAWDRYRDCIELDAPRATTLSKLFKNWPALQDATVEFMSKRPEQFPKANEYWRLKEAMESHSADSESGKGDSDG